MEQEDNSADAGNRRYAPPGFTPTSPFGLRAKPTGTAKTPEFHKGVDYGAALGRTVPAAASGEVVYSGPNQRGYGNAVILKHRGDDGGDFYTLYAHMNGRDMAEPGMYVNFGEKIGEVGNTGESKGPHLHFEVLRGDARVNHSAGGPIGVGENDLQARADPDAFSGWPAGGPFRGVQFVRPQFPAPQRSAQVFLNALAGQLPAPDWRQRGLLDPVRLESEVAPLLATGLLDAPAGAASQ